MIMIIVIIITIIIIILLIIINPRDQNSPKALYSVVFGPKSLNIWVVVKIMVPVWVPSIIRHTLFRVPKKGTLILKTTHMSP